MEAWLTPQQLIDEVADEIEHLARLLATGDGRLINGVDFNRYWGSSGTGRNWLGRILELVRAEVLELQELESGQS